MSDTKEFKDIFALWAEDFSKALKGLKGEKNTLDLEVGETVLTSINKTMATESVDGEAVSIDKPLAEFMMACEAAESDLLRLRGISYSMALKHANVIGIEVTPQNFSTHVGKKNYDLALENIKGYLLIGASVALVAGIGYLVFKLLTARKEKPTKGKEVVGVAKDMNKATGLFSSIDLSILPKELQDKYYEKAKEESHIGIQRIAHRDHYIKQGYELEVANQLSLFESTVLDDVCLSADGGSWVVECHNRHAQAILDNMEGFVSIATRAGKVDDEILGVDARVIEGRVDAARQSRHLDFGRCAATSGYVGNADPLFEDWVEWLKMGSMMDLAPQMQAVSKGVVPPSASEYETFEQLKAKMVKLGERFEKASKKMERNFEDQVLNDLIAKLKFDLEELELMRNVVSLETKALADSFRLKVDAAKKYSARVHSFLEELIDEDMKKQIQEQLKKAITALPSRKIATEDVEGEAISGDTDSLFPDQHPLMTNLNKITCSEGEKEKSSEQVAVESITGDGIELVEKEVTQYLEQPEYQQAGYRFDPREGYDGANLMAMEGWTIGAKVALGVGAAVAILGIGALVASTVIKRNATLKDRHATKEQIQAVLDNVEQLDDATLKIVKRIQRLQQIAGTNAVSSKYPLLSEQVRELMRTANRISTKRVERNGQEIDQMQAMIEDLGDDTALQTQRLVAVGAGAPNSTYFAEDGSLSWTVAIKDFFDNVVIRAVSDLDKGRAPEVVLEEITQWWESTQGRRSRVALSNVMDDIDSMKSKIDIHWGVGKGEGSFRVEHRTDILNVLGYAKVAQEDLVRVHVELTKEFDRYILDDKILNRFRRIEEESKGNRDAAASVLRRIEEFRPFFALYARLVRYEAEYIEQIMSFADRFLKTYARLCKGDIEAMKQLSQEVSKMEAEDWAADK